MRTLTTGVVGAPPAGGWFSIGDPALFEDPPLPTRFLSNGPTPPWALRFFVSIAPTLLGLALCLGVVGAGLWGEGDRILGSPGGEVWGHAWVLFWLGEALPEWPDGPGKFLVPTREWVVVDPLPAFLGALISRIGGPTGPIWGWNLLVLGWFALAVVGGARLARTWGGDPMTGGLFLGLSPVLAGAAASGLSEDLGVGLLAFGLAAVTGNARPLVQGLQAGFYLGVAALCGPLLAFGGGLLVVPAALVAPGRAPRLLGLGLGVLPLGGLAIGRLGERLLGVGHRFGVVPGHGDALGSLGALPGGPGSLRHWALNPWHGNDLASFLIPGRVAIPEEPLRLHPAYLCWSLLGLAVVGTRGFRGLLAWGALGALVMVSVGSEVVWMGQPLGLPNPAARALAWFPGGTLVNHHGRLLLPGVVVLAGLAARGVRRLQAAGSHRPGWEIRGWRARGLVAAFVALFLLEVGACSPLGLSFPTADTSVPGALSTGTPLQDGVLLVLPAGGPGVHFQRPLLDQRVHRQPLGLDPNRPGLPATFSRGAGGDFLANLNENPAEPAAFRWPARVGQILVREPWVDVAAKVLGEPTIRSKDSALWVRLP